MKKFVLSTFIVFAFLSPAFTQNSCNDIMNYVKSKDYGLTYYSPQSDAIRSVSFHEYHDQSYQTYHFAIVQFTTSTNQYIYQVPADTRWKYATKYTGGAGEAFWAYIHPYRKALGCAPDFK